MALVPSAQGRAAHHLGDSYATHFGQSHMTGRIVAPAWRFHYSELKRSTTMPKSSELTHDAPAGFAGWDANGNPVILPNPSTLRPLAQALRESGLPITRQGVLKWIKAEWIPAYRIGHRWFLDPADLRAMFTKL
jgi:hypothetical protein